MKLRIFTVKNDMAADIEQLCARALKISVTKILLIFCSSSSLDVKKIEQSPSDIDTILKLLVPNRDS